LPRVGDRSRYAKCGAHCSEALAPVRDDLPHNAKQPAAFGGEDTLVDW